LSIMEFIKKIQFANLLYILISSFILQIVLYFLRLIWFLTQLCKGLYRVSMK
jgi:hypothetical protein